MTHPKIATERFTRVIDRYVAAHPDALVVLATDDRAYHGALAARYGPRLVSGGTGYATRNVVRDPSLGRYEKGRSGLVDALLLAHCDFVLKGTSSLSEFSLWYNPSLIERHLDLQIDGAGATSAAYTSRVPTWAGGPYEPPPLERGSSPRAMLARLLEGAPPGSAEAATRGDGRAGRAAGLGPAAGRGRRRAAGRGRRAVSERRRRGAAPSHRAITSGTCAGVGLALLGKRECRALAESLGRKFIGETREPGEFPGCVSWRAGHGAEGAPEFGVVEYNAHADEARGCTQGERRTGECLCGAARD